MQVTKNHNSIRTGITGWISMSINGDHDSVESERPAEVAKSDREINAVRPDCGRLFALAERLPTPLPERYPRLTFAVIAVLLLASALTAELEYLRVAGYSWP